MPRVYITDELHDKIAALALMGGHARFNSVRDADGTIEMPHEVIEYFSRQSLEGESPSDTIIRMITKE